MTDAINVRTVVDLKHDGGIRTEFVDAWLSVFRRTPGAEEFTDFPLTELQRIVANDSSAKLVSGPNLVVAGPTSAGKTFAAEMIIARLLTAARPPYGCIYAVPTRALATEKWERFKSVFGEEHVYVSSGDYQDQDAYILHRRFRIAVVVYEKLFGWLLQPNARNAILKNLGLLIVDELQMLGDTQRGPRLELLLTFVRQLQAEGSKLRIVGLGPDRDALGGVADWLGASLAATGEEQRPVPLAEGYVCPNKVHLVKVDPRLARDTVFVPQPRGTTRDAMLIDLVTKLLERDGLTSEVGTGKRLLVYSPTKDGAERTAQALTDALGTRQDVDRPTAQAFDALERTHATERLRKTVLAGVGFHHGDLLFEERGVVERLFRGEGPSTCLDVVICTPTLAMGVNLPADYMLFPSSESYKPKDWDARTNLPTPLTPLEYRNFAGRAGRHRPNAPPNHHGVALFISDRTDEETMREIAEPIILGKVTPIASEMHRWPFGIETLALAAADTVSGARRAMASHEGVFNIFQSTYAASSDVRLTEKGVAVPLAVGVIPRLKELASRHVELITDDFAVPRTGNVVARAGIHILTYEALKGIVERVQNDILDQPLVILEELALVPEIVKLYPTSLADSAKEQMVLTRALREFLRELKRIGHTLGPRAETMISQTHVPDRTTLEGLMRVAAVWLFIEGKTAEQIGASPMLPRIRYGACNLLGDQLHWLVSTLPDLWDALGLSAPIEDAKATDLRWAMGRLERRLRFGVPDALVGIAQLRVPGLHRENMMDIWNGVAEYRHRDWGWDHPVELLDIPAKQLGHWSKLVRSLQRAIIGRAWTDDPREAWQKQIDVARMASDGDGSRYVAQEWPDVLRALLTEEDNTELLRKLTHALTLKPLNLNVQTQPGAAAEGTPFVFHDGRWISLAAVGNGTVATWNDIRGLSAAAGPTGKAVDGVLVLANGSVDDTVAAEVRSFGRAIRVLTRDALGHMIVQALLAPEDTDTPENPKTNPQSVSQVVRNWLTAETGGVLMSVPEAEQALKNSGLDDWSRESRSMQGRAGRNDDRAPVVDVRQRTLREKKLDILRSDIGRLDLTRHADVLDGSGAEFIGTLIDDFLKEADRLEAEPSEVAGVVRTSVEELATHVLNDHGERPNGALEQMLEAVRAKSIMSSNWVQSAHTVRLRSNAAHHVKGSPDARGRFTIQAYSFEEALELLSVAVRLWSEYLEKRPNLPLARLQPHRA